MNGVPYGSQGAQYFESGSIRVTGSFSALQGLVDAKASSAAANGGTRQFLTGSFTEFESITWGRADAAGLADFTSSKVHNVKIGPGDIIYGPIYGFNLLSGSCLAYQYKKGFSY